MKDYLSKTSFLHIFFGFLVFFTGFLSCSKGAPRIEYGFIELVYYSGNEIPEEHFSFFVLAEDDDGAANLSELYLYHDREGLRWLISSEDWILYEEDGKTWIGSRSLSMEEGTLPRGQYRAVLENKSGEKTERFFTFDGPEAAPYPFPFFTVLNGMYRIDSRYPVNNLVLYDQQGKFVQKLTISDIEGNIKDLRMSSNARTAALWAEDPEYHISALTEAVLLR